MRLHPRLHLIKRHDLQDGTEQGSDCVNLKFPLCPLR